MNNKRVAAILAAAAAAAVIAVAAIAVTTGDGSAGTDVAADGTEPTATAPPAVQATVTAPATTPAQAATAFWQALAARDRQSALALVDPVALDSPGPSPFGRAHTLQGQFDWYEAVGWQWQLDECIDRDDGAAECMATGSNAWSEALGVAPIEGTFVVRVGENGVTDVGDQFGAFLGRWSEQVFEVFTQWVSENHPDDEAVMFDFSVDINSEILGLYEENTARFVEAQQTE